MAGFVIPRVPVAGPSALPLAARPWALGWAFALLLAAWAPARAHASPFGVLPPPALRPPGVVPQPATAPPIADPIDPTDEDPGPDPDPDAGDAGARDPDAPPRLSRKRSVPPFWIHRELDTHTTRALTFPPLFVHRKPAVGHPEKLLHVDLALTFGWYDKRRNKRRWLNPAGLFLGSYSDHKSVWAAVPLLMGYKRVSEQFNFGQFPLVWWWGNRHAKNFFVLPLHYHQKTPDAFRAVTGLVVWYGSKDLGDKDPLNDRKHRIVFPVWLRHKKGLRQVDVSPVYVGGFNEAKGRRWRSVIPLFLWESLEHGNRRELWTLPWIDRSDRARGKRSWAVPPLLTFSHRDPQRGVMAVTPLLWRTQNARKGSTAWFVGPVGTWHDPRQANHWVAPLWWHLRNRETQTSTSLFVPLVHARRSPEETRVDTPLASGLRGRDGARAFGIWPLGSHVRWGGPGRSHQFLFAGTFWHFSNPAAFDGRGADRWGVGPLLYRTRRGDRFDFGIPPLLVFADRRGPRSKQVITPLFWHVRDRSPEVDGRTVVLAPFYVSRRRGDVQVGLPPLFMARKGEVHDWGFALPILLGHNADHRTGERRTISPLFALASRPGHRTLGAGVLFWDVRHPDERHSVLFPLYYRRQVDSTVLTFTPLGGGRREGAARTFVVGPVVGRRDADRRGLGVLPLFFHETRRGGPARGATTVLLPLYVRDRRPERDLDMVTPLLWRSAVRGSKPRRGLAVVPFYFRQRQPGGVDVDAGLPFFHARDRTRHTHTLVVGPYYHRLTRTKLHTGVAPLTWWTDSVEERRLIALPLIFHQEAKKTGKRTTVALPLWFDRRLENGRRTWMAFPFVLGRKGQYNFTRVSVTPPGFFDVFRLARNYRFTGYVPLLWRYEKCGFRRGDPDGCEYVVWGSFPLFLAGRDGKGRRTHGALGLYYFDRDPGGTRLYTWLAGGNYRKGERLMWYALTLFRDTTRQQTTTGFLPLFFHRRHRDASKDRSTTLVLPPAFIGQHKGDRRWWTTALMVWHVRRPHKVTTLVAPPIVGVQHAWAERRLTWVAPLFLRDNHRGRDRSTTLLPPGLFVQHRRGGNQTAIQFPLVWHFVRDGDLTTIGLPLFYDVRRGKNRTQLVPAVYARRRTELHDLHVVGPGLAWWAEGVGPREGDRRWRALLGLFGGGREAGQRYVALFGARIPIGGRSTATIHTANTDAASLREAQSARNERIETAAGMM
jgi:hypothetical protein